MAIELKKDSKISLEKKSNNTLGEILVNLNWNQGGAGKSIDLDLGCLYELKDGTKGAVQALGKAFGSLDKPPFITLDGDDRTGESAEGENLRINGDKISSIKRILVYTFIYEGAADWKQTDGVVTIKYPGSQDIIVRLDEYGSTQTMCGIIMLENSSDETFTVEKLVKFFKGHEALDRTYNWGMKWVTGKKD
jgi:tellurite resistance protein TerA